MKIPSIIISFSLFLFTSSFAQNWSWELTAEITSTATSNPIITLPPYNSLIPYDNIADASKDSQGNIYILGESNRPDFNFGDLLIENEYINDLFLIKIQPSGSIEWTKTISGIHSENAYAVECDSDDNIYIGGRFSSPILFIDNHQLNLNGDYSTFLTKINSSGNIIWAKTIENIGDIYDFTINNIGVAIATATSFNSQPIVILPVSDTIIPLEIKTSQFDSDGNIVWQYVHEITPDSGHLVNTIQLTSNSYDSLITAVSFAKMAIGYDPSHPIITSYVKSTNAFIYSSKNETVGWTKKIESNPSLIHNLQDIETNELDEIYLSSGIQNTSTNGTLFKLSHLGDVLWSKEHPLINFKDIELSANGIYLTGKCYSSSNLDGYTFTCESGFNAFIAKIDVDGTYLEVNCFSGNKDDSFDFIFNHNEQVSVIGKSESEELKLGELTIYNKNILQTTTFHGGYTEYRDPNFFVAAYDKSLAIESNQHSIESEFIEGAFVFPNPSNGLFSIIDLEEAQQINIIDPLGKYVRKINVQNNQKELHDIDLSTESKGIYFVEIKSNGNLQRIKIIVQ